MKSCTKICGWAMVVALLATPAAWAQQDDTTTTQDEPAVEEVTEDTDEDNDVDDDEGVDDEDAEAIEEDDDAPADELPEEEPPPVIDEPAPEPVETAPVEEAPEDWPEDWDNDFDTFADDIEFVPLEELDDAVFDRITPRATYPFVEYNGMLRVRSRARVNFDLDTRGTSAVLAPLDTVVPTEEPANEDASLLWTTDLRLRLAPTFHLGETFRIHTDFDFLRNSAFGDDPRYNFFVQGLPSPDRRVSGTSIGTSDLILVRQAYAEIDTIVGTVMAGRMLNHWGLGIFANDGNCADCDWGDQVDRVALRLPPIMDFYVMAAYDFPDSGIAADGHGFEHGHPHSLAQLDTTRQWTASVSRTAHTREDREREAHRLRSLQLPVYNGGLYFTSRSREGQFLDAETFDIDAPSDPIYRGMQLYTLAPWARLLWNPEEDRRIRVELEGLTTLGRVDNTTNNPVGFLDTEGDSPNVNCFADDQREANPAACRTDEAGNDTSRNVRQFGLALESEFYFGGPVSFGLNGGFATGGDTPNWGYLGTPGQQLDFTRFNPDYHVDLILFREVIGTVTNATYINPYLLTRFWDTGLQRMELQFDLIGSRALNAEGTPGGSNWLGLEANGSLRFLSARRFLASLDAGILFPMGGLAAVAGRERLNHYGDLGDFAEDRNPSLAWTVQGRLIWNF